MTEVLVLSTPGCTHCAAAKKILEKLKKEIKGLIVKEIDITKDPSILQKYPVMSAPGIVINGKLEFTGGVSEAQLRKKLKGK